MITFTSFASGLTPRPTAEMEAASHLHRLSDISEPLLFDKSPGGMRPLNFPGTVKLDVLLMDMAETMEYSVRHLDIIVKCQSTYSCRLAREHDFRGGELMDRRPSF